MSRSPEGLKTQSGSASHAGNRLQQRSSGCEPTDEARRESSPTARRAATQTTIPRSTGERKQMADQISSSADKMLPERLRLGSSTTSSNYRAARCPCLAGHSSNCCSVVSLIAGKACLPTEPEASGSNTSLHFRLTITFLIGSARSTALTETEAFRLGGDRRRVEDHPATPVPISLAIGANSWRTQAT
jgi:hypothetical protein